MRRGSPHAGSGDSEERGKKSPSAGASEYGELVPHSVMNYCGPKHPMLTDAVANKAYPLQSEGLLRGHQPRAPSASYPNS